MSGFDYVLDESRPNRQVPESGGHLEQDCWCNPEVLQLCQECAGDCTTGGVECWRCAGRGLVPEYDPEITSVIVHTAERFQ